MSLFAPVPAGWNMPLSFKPFTWIAAEEIGACIYPQSDVELAELAGLGVTLLVNLHERAHTHETLTRHGVRQLHLPVPDLTPPDADQLELGIAEIEEELKAGGRVVVHCAAGLGRTGTLLACLYVRRGLTANEAIEFIRGLRPGSIESDSQVEAIKRFAQAQPPEPPPPLS